MEENKQEEIKQEEPVKTEISEDGVGMAIIAYIIFFVPLLTDSKDNPFIKFHVKQSLTLFCFYVAFQFLRFFPFIGRMVWILSSVVSLVWFAFIIVGIFNAANRKQKELPIIGQFAEKWFKF